MGGIKKQREGKGGERGLEIRGGGDKKQREDEKRGKGVGDKMGGLKNSGRIKRGE